ncbi:MAG: TIR domain-containing protein [Verrucomicrobiales bacterium]|nr:TIR domain-containing protein [Verrucomicrobiales bacterium]MCP5525192.1 TIR domain-containing protein [Verrucomicrobiales bacterium]
MESRTLPKRFLVAFSFAGEQRDLVRSIAAAVEQRLGRGTVFFDEWFEAWLAGPDADIRLQRIYHERAELVVPCISERYEGKPWTWAEYEAIRALRMKLHQSGKPGDDLRVLPLRVGDGDVKGIHFNAIVPDVRHRPPEATAQLIVDRLRHIDPALIPTRPSVGDQNPEAPPPRSASPPPSPAAPERSVREAKIEFCRRLGAPSWLELADHLGIRRDERDTWAKGHEARAIWEWLENRRRLPDLAAACRKINRPDLADLLEGLDFPR